MLAVLSNWQSPRGTYSSPAAYRLPIGGFLFFLFLLKKAEGKGNEEKTINKIF